MSHLFRDRHIGTTTADQAHMLSRIGVGSTEELMERALPATIRLEDHEDADLGVPPAASEAHVLAELQQFARRNEIGRAHV